MEKKYLREQKEKILDFSRELYKSSDISEDKLKDVYFHNFIINKNTK